MHKHLTIHGLFFMNGRFLNFLLCCFDDFVATLNSNMFSVTGSYLHKNSHLLGTELKLNG